MAVSVFVVLSRAMKLGMGKVIFRDWASISWTSAKSFRFILSLWRCRPRALRVDPEILTSVFGPQDKFDNVVGATVRQIQLIGHFPKKFPVGFSLRPFSLLPNFPQNESRPAN